MTFRLRVHSSQWRAHLDSVYTPDVIPVIKGNGYGLGRDQLAGEAHRLGADLIAVGTYPEVPDALKAFDGDIMVLSPWRPFWAAQAGQPALDPRVIHTLGRVRDIEALAAAAPAGTRVMIEGLTTMERHGLDRHELAAAAEAIDHLSLFGAAIHLPLSDSNLTEADTWAGVVQASQLPVSTLFVSHLDDDELAALRAKRPELTIRPRVGTRLWLGDLTALDVRATVLDRHEVSRGERVGYRQRPMPRDGHVLIVSGGTSHGVGLASPRGAGGLTTRGKALARGGLEAAGLHQSPFVIEGRQRWFAEPPHMQASMLFVPGSTEPPEIGDEISAHVRYTTATFDRIDFD